MPAGNSRPNNSLRCELCGRIVPDKLTGIHHLHPRSHGGGPEDEANMCSTCHRFIHATFTNRTLAESFNTLQKLRFDEEVQRFVRWMRKQDPKRRFPVDRRNPQR